MSDVDVREHGRIEETLKGQCKRIDDMYENWGKFYETQEGRREEQDQRYMSKFEELRQGIDRKAELDGVLLNKVSELSRRVEYLAGKKEKADEAQRHLLVYFSDIRDLLKSADLRKMKLDLEAAHAWKREHEKMHTEKIEPRIDKLETRGGKAALRLLQGVGLTVSGGVAFMLIEKLIALIARVSAAKGGTP